jgi:RNA polymerase sigma-54 factor
MELIASLRLETRPSLVTVLAANLLALNREQLDAAVEREIERNPALQRHPICRRCGGPSTNGLCGACRREVPRLPPQTEPVAGAGWRDLLEGDALLVAPRRLHAAIRVIVGSLSSRGLLLDTSVAELIDLSGSTATEVVDALATLRRVGPPGIAATGAAECLLAQLSASAAGTPELRSLAGHIIAEHLPLLAAGRLDKIVEVTTGDPSEVADAVRFIRRRLQPWPVPDDDEGTVRAPPDVVVRMMLDGARTRLVAEVPDRWRHELQISPDIEALTRTADMAGAAFAAGLVAQARAFVLGVRHRASTIERVAEAAVAHHVDALADGSLAFARLTRRQIGGELGIHESSVGRAVQDRTVQLPSGGVVPFARLFGSGHDARARLVELLSGGNTASDRQLALLLSADGIEVSRRTVAKYRAQLGHPRRPKAVSASFAS